MKINRKLYALPVMTVAALLAAACSGGSSNSGNSVTIRAILPPNTGPISSPQNASLQKFTQEYQSKHPNVSVEWQPNPVSSITTANATLVSQGQAMITRTSSGSSTTRCCRASSPRASCRI